MRCAFFDVLTLTTTADNLLTLWCCHSRTSLLLLVSHGLTGTLAGTGVRLGTLTSYGQSLSVTYTAVTSDIDESLDIIGDVTAKVTFYTAVVLDVLSEL